MSDCSACIFPLSLSKFQISSHFHYHIPPSLFTVTVRVNCAIRKYPTVQPDFFHFHFQIITFVFNFAFTSYFHISFFNTFQPGKEYMASLTMVRQFFTFTFSNQIFKISLLFSLLSIFNRRRHEHRKDIISQCHNLEMLQRLSTEYYEQNMLQLNVKIIRNWQHMEFIQYSRICNPWIEILHNFDKTLYLSLPFHSDD